MRTLQSTICLMSLVLVMCLAPARPAHALEIVLTDPDADYFDDGTDPCPRGDENDDCWVNGYLNTDVAANEYWEVFDSAWTAWNGAQPPGQQWTLVHGPALNGVLEIETFDTYNDCPGKGGVEVDAYFHPQGDDPTDWFWAQGLYDNYDAGPMPPHDSPGAPARFEMDVDPAGDWPPPLYPHQYADGSFYDRPGAGCIHEDTVFFDAVALIVQADFATRTLTAYEGFSYGFDFTCVHIPEPASLALLIVGSLGALRRRRMLRT